MDDPYFKNFYYGSLSFIETTTLRNYADDNTMYSSVKNANIVISRLRHYFLVFSKYVEHNVCGFKLAQYYLIYIEIFNI